VSPFAEPALSPFASLRAEGLRVTTSAVIHAFGGTRQKCSPKGERYDALWGGETSAKLRS